MRLNVCPYCNTANKASEDACVACGAPLEKLPPPPRPVSYSRSRPVAATSPFGDSSEDVHKVAQTAEKVYNGAVRAYAIFWRTLGEAIAIAVTGFALGLIGGATDTRWISLGCAVAVGVAVALTNKLIWLTAVSAPIGAMIGAMIWGAAMIFGAGPQGLPITAAVGAILLALLGSRRTSPTCWDWVRPFLGATGGMMFALVGMLLGVALRAILAGG
jgi:hypothetical protein